MQRLQPPRQLNAFRTGFTLIELLVVVTIIVVLLALLTPALDKAVYQAQLTVCGTHLKAIATGTTLYAVDNKRRYPVRPQVENGNRQPHLVYNGDPRQNGGGMYIYDERIVLRPYLGLNATLNDPLTGEVDIEGSAPDSMVYVPYVLRFGWLYREDGAPRPGMTKLGDRWSWQDSSYNILASDWDNIDRNGQGAVQASHPDADGVLENRVFQDEDWTLRYNYSANMTYSFWATNNTEERGPVDLNFAYQDGSVRRYNRVLWDDPRMVPGVPNFSGGQYWPLTADSTPQD